MREVRSAAGGMQESHSPAPGPFFKFSIHKWLFLFLCAFVFFFRGVLLMSCFSSWRRSYDFDDQCHVFNTHTHPVQLPIILFGPFDKSFAFLCKPHPPMLQTLPRGTSPSFVALSFSSNHIINMLHIAVIMLMCQWWYPIFLYLLPVFCPDKTMPGVCFPIVRVIMVLLDLTGHQRE